jgi:hypothetical protein
MLKVRSGQERLFACDALCHHRAYGTVTFCVNYRRRNRSELYTQSYCSDSDPKLSEFPQDVDQKYTVHATPDTRCVQLFLLVK